MSSSMHTILIIGGTSGIGEAFARRFHNMGKKVIITGRRQDRLNNLQRSMSGLETYEMDNKDFQSLPGHVEKLFAKFPTIDTVWVNSGIQYASSIKDSSSSTDEKVIEEMNVNVTAPMILARHFIPKLLAQDTETAFMITTSGLGYVAGALFPVYCATKAAIHQYLVAIRQGLKDTKCNIIEIAPPYVGSTELGAEHSEAIKHVTPMPMEEFTNTVFGVLESKPAKDLKEIGAGHAAASIEAWRGSIGKILEARGIGG